MKDDPLLRSIPLGASGARKGWRCPDEERLAAWVEGSLAAADRERVADHLPGCAFCRGQVGFLARSAEMGPPPAVPVDLLSRARGESAWHPGLLRPATLAAAAASLVLALLVTTPWGHPAFPPEVVTRGPSLPVPRGAGDVPRILVPAEGASVRPAALELRWEETADALFYTVQLVDPEGDVAWEGRADGVRLAVPADARLVPGRPYFAWVIAHLRNGTTARSPAVGFRLESG